MAAGDATPFPVKNQAYRVTFPIFDNDGDLVTGAAGLDSEVSKDGGTFADCTSEATEIATSSGVYYLDLTATEMNADTVAIIVKTTTTDAKTTPIVLYPAPAERGLTGTALPAAAADAAGGIPISDAGGLDIDAKLANTNEVTAARMGALTDWIDGGRLDLLLDAILLDTGTTMPATLTTISGYVDALETRIPDTISLAAINAEVDTAIETYHLDHLLAVDYDPASKPGVATALLNELIENDAGVSRFTANALEEAPAGSPPSAATIADAVWDEAGSGHVGAGTFGKYLGDADTSLPGIAAGSNGGLPTVDANNRIVGLQGTLNDFDGLEAASIAAILLDTGTTLPATLTTISGYVDELETRLTAARAGYLDNLNGHTAQTGDSFARLGAPAGASVSADIATLDGNVDTLVTRVPNTISLAAINAEVVDVMTVDTIAELGVAAPATTPTFATALMLLYMALRNKQTSTSSAQTISNDAGTTICTSVLTDAAGTFTRAEFG